MIPRLYTQSPLTAGAMVPLPPGQIHYLRHVLRRSGPEPLLLFNGRDGLWQATLDAQQACVQTQLACQPPPEPPLVLAFCVIKQSDWLVEKATELGATRIMPLFSQHTSLRHFSAQRHQKIIHEACEQCGRLTLPQLDDARPLGHFLQMLAPPHSQVAAVSDDHQVKSTLSQWVVLDPLSPHTLALPRPMPGTIQADNRGYGLLVGPEGGWAPAERALFLANQTLTLAHLGTRILRAETAALAGLALLGWAMINQD